MLIGDSAISKMYSVFLLLTVIEQLARMSSLSKNMQYANSIRLTYPLARNGLVSYFFYAERSTKLFCTTIEFMFTSVLEFGADPYSVLKKEAG